MLYIKTLLIGLAAGYLSGQFGIGGGLITTPGLRLVLMASPGIALGTTLPVIVPSALAGSINYIKDKLVDWKLAVRLSAPGLLGTILGAFMTAYINTDLLLFITSIVILAVALSYIVPHKRRQSFFRFLPEAPATLAIGLSAGFLAGLLGIGGGFLIIPSITDLLDRPIKTAFGTSLIVVAVFALPGSVVHYHLGHIDLSLMSLLVLGVIPGAHFGSKIAIGMREESLRFSFGAFLAMVSLYFAYHEALSLGFGGA